ncbi:DMT family transporter [Maricurvus nonylphenolicus]|uniref:DMT family transporter n=1 Tax=Maricurvus nonylphenolicus TaxID=1008307 RepID=UPI0036F2B33B
MAIAIAYGVLILIWTTTPLAINFSNSGFSFIAAVSARMCLALVIAVAILILWRRKLPTDDKSLKNYFIASLGIFPYMPLVYWSAQFIPSGLLPVIMGISPFVTGLLSLIMLKENPFTLPRIMALLLALLGLGVILADQQHQPGNAVFGVIGMLSSCVLLAWSSIWLQQQQHHLPPLEHTTGALMFAVPSLIACWYGLDGTLPEVDTNMAAVGSTVYLATCGTLLGYSLYFYLLRELGAMSISLITLVTPLLALWLGAQVAHEQLSPQLLAGTGLVLGALVTYHSGTLLKPLFRRQKTNTDQETLELT